MSEETFGFNGYTLPELSQIISKLLNLPAVHRDNTYWGDYYLFEPDPTRSDDHTLVWNEIPPRYTDPDEAEPATDLCAVALGFGVFGAACAFNFSQYQDSGSHGWSTSSLGYLTEREWAFALAAWLELEGHAVQEVRGL